MAYLQNRHEEQERAEARVRAHLLKYHVDVVNVLICHIHLPEELMKTQTEKILAEQRQNMFNAQREAEEKRIQLEKTKAHADNQRDLMAATVGVEISTSAPSSARPKPRARRTTSSRRARPRPRRFV
jgi:regulator of protease activity HflC (stomatin/prohibitin superfamily)